ncbi:NAD-dependent epimerase/dehydratase family protein [Terasakiella sp.]|uniref:NAD-dependent epimerase/dehydratase family protein n=1 Tax=Terasakiella sp. TaxID=2034861 RepID=UPI003AA9AE7F
MKKILITGANGLLGQSLIKYFSGYYKVYATSYAEPQTKLAGVEYLNIDLAREWNACKFLPAVDVIVHAAQSSKYRDFPDKAMDIFSVNTDSTARLLDFASKVGAAHFIYFSTGGLYKTSEQALNEQSELLPINELNYHFASKLCGEVLANTYKDEMIISIVRPFFIYGEGQRASMLIPRLINQIKMEQEIFIDGENGLRINPVHALDGCRFVEKLVNAALPGVFNLAGPEILTLKDICLKIGTLCNKKPVFSYKKNPINDLFSSTEKMTSIDAAPQIGFSEGIKGMIHDN